VLAGCGLRVGTVMTSGGGLLCLVCTELDVCSKAQISLLTFCGESVAQRTIELLVIYSPGWKLSCVFVK